MNEDGFTPFVPELPPAPVHEKKPRKKRGPNKSPPAAKKKRTVIQPGPVTQVALAIARGDAKRREKRNAKQPREAKYTLSEALSIGSALTPEDMKMFGQIESDLRALPKAARARILAAVGRVFA